MIKSVGEQGKRYNTWRAEQKRKLKDPYSCSVLECENVIADKKGQFDHMLTRPGLFADLKMDPENVRWTCGQHQEIEQMDLAERVEYIGFLWGLDAHLYALEHTDGMIDD